MAQTRSHSQNKPSSPPVATSQCTKRKCGPKKMSAEEQEAAQQAKVAVSKQLAKLEVAHPCDNDLPTPRPQSESQCSSTTLSQTNSWADISALVAQQRCAEKEVASRPAAGDIVADGSTAGGTTEPSGWLFTNDSLTDEEDHQVPVKKF